MNLTLWQVIMVVTPLILIEGFFAGSEIALLSADKLHLKTLVNRGSRAAKLALELVMHPERILSTTLLMTNLCMIGISAVITLYSIKQVAEHSELIAVLVTSPLVVLLGELIPKTIYQRYADRVATVVVYPVLWAYWIFFPLTRLMSSYTSRLSRMVGPIEELLTGRRRTTRDELRSMLSYSKGETEIKASEKRMIKRIFDFKDTEAKHALIPLVRVEAIEENSTVRQALERFQNHRHSRMPVYSGRVDNIIGVLESSDLFAALDLTQNIRKFMTRAHYVAETHGLDLLLLDMKREDHEMVVIVDEYGGAVGILTFEDIIEEIVGEIQDEDDTELKPYREVEPGHWLVQARMEVAQINEILKVELPEGDYETLGGFLLQQFGRIPENRDELYFDTPAGGFKFVIRKANERQIESVVIEKLPEKKES